MPNWLLPENISDGLPTEARRIETLRRRLLDLFATYGYELVQPPLIEYAQALADTGGSDLDLRMFKLVDQLTGRTLAVRADMTPQVARIDAQRLNRQGVTRLSYCGSVMHARPEGPGASREIMQIGAELYGHAGLEADIEAVALMLEALSTAGLNKLRVEIGHLGLLRAVLALDVSLQEEVIFPYLLARDIPALKHALAGSPACEALLVLASLQALSIVELRQRLPKSAPITQALDQCASLLAAAPLARFPQASFALDLGDAHGYRYHSGITFSAYRLGESESIGRGGRYDDIGRRFGRARPATGFSLNLRALASLALEPGPGRSAIVAPWTDSASLATKVALLRAQGHIVIQQLAGEASEAEEFVCDQQLVHTSGEWIVTKRT
jgi:ATP phosphoribosyltransferase regulatory subunit